VAPFNVPNADKKATAQCPFMRLAGAVKGDPDLSVRKGFSRK
jgi:hypothetical protein